MDQRLAVFDLDGTLMRGNQSIAGAIEAVQRARTSGWAVRVLTNNSGASTADLVERLASGGFDFSEQEVLGTAVGTATWCVENGIRSVFVVGEVALEQACLRAGLDVVTGSADGLVVGICRTSWNYALLDNALQCLVQGARFVATNRDRTYPLESGRIQPGAGAMVGAIAAMLGREPEAVIGKPNPFLVERLMESVGASPESTLVIGDRPETDLECGRAIGCRTWLVLTGVTDELGGWDGGQTLDDLDFSKSIDVRP